jgi:hypothetical protein
MRNSCILLKIAVILPPFPYPLALNSETNLVRVSISWATLALP